jgi:hypothetical protein
MYRRDALSARGPHFGYQAGYQICCYAYEVRPAGAAGFDAASPDAASNLLRSEVQDEPEHREANTTERREEKRAVDSHREVVGWAPGSRLGCTCRAPDRFCVKRPETAPTDSPLVRCARGGSRIASA